MKIKNLKNNRIDTVSYKEWKDNYIDKATYKDYEIIDYFGLVEIHRLLKDGSTRFTFMRKSDAIKQKNQFLNEFEIRELTFNGYDKWLVKEENYQSKSRFKHITSFITNIPTIKDIKQIIVNSTASKILGNFIFYLLITVIGGL